MNEGIKALLEKVTADEDLLAKFSACKSADEAFELATGIVGGYTKEEFIETMTALSSAENGDISDGDLAEAAGGADPALSGFGQIYESVKDTATHVSDFVSDVAKSYSKGTVAVTKFFGESQVLDVTKDAATAVSNYTYETVKSLAKSAVQVSKQLAV